MLFNPDKLRSTPMHDPLATFVYSSSAENVDITMVDGKVVSRKGEFSCGIDESQIAGLVRAELKSIGLTGACSHIDG